MLCCPVHLQLEADLAVRRARLQEEGLDEEEEEEYDLRMVSGPHCGASYMQLAELGGCAGKWPVLHPLQHSTASGAPVLWLEAL
jgi:hypothetical protein